jgi:putative membrane protein
MAEDQKPVKTNNQLAEERTELAGERTDFAFERTSLAHERTLMAWIRTGTAMISFGFTIYKFFQELTKVEDAPPRLLSPRVVGMIMIGFGFLGLLFAEIQHLQAIIRLKKFYPDMPKSLSSVLAFLILIFGLLLFLAALFRQ